MSYRILQTERFEEALRQILVYVTENAQDASPALQLLDETEKAVRSLAEFPKCGAMPWDRHLKALGYRYLRVKTYLLFYYCSEETVYILTIVHEKQAYKDML